jgi:hypothetical protein
VDIAGFRAGRPDFTLTKYHSSGFNYLIFPVFASR